MKDDTPAPANATTPKDSPAGMSPSAKPAAKTEITKKQGFWLRRRTIPLPTWRLWLCLLTTLGAASFLIGRHSHEWLSVTQPVPDAKYLIVEGWLSDNANEAAGQIADATQATRVFCTGQPLERGSYLLPWKDYAHLTANSLAKIGMDPQRICPVPAPDAQTDRTQNMAIALKAVLDQEPVPSTGRRINLISQGTHARRSWQIFKEVLGQEWQVGVYSVPDPSYDAETWYRSSTGVKSVVIEVTGLIARSFGLVD